MSKGEFYLPESLPPALQGLGRALPGLQAVCEGADSLAPVVRLAREIAPVLAFGQALTRWMPQEPV